MSTKRIAILDNPALSLLMRRVRGLKSGRRIKAATSASSVSPEETAKVARRDNALIHSE